MCLNFQLKHRSWIQTILPTFQDPGYKKIQSKKVLEAIQNQEKQEACKAAFANLVSTDFLKQNLGNVTTVCENGHKMPPT